MLSGVKHASRSHVWHFERLNVQRWVSAKVGVLRRQCLRTRNVWQRNCWAQASRCYGAGSPLSATRQMNQAASGRAVFQQLQLSLGDRERFVSPPAEVVAKVARGWRRQFWWLRDWRWTKKVSDPGSQRGQSAKRVAILHSEHLASRFRLTGRKGVACKKRIRGWKRLSQHGQRLQALVRQTSVLELISMVGSEPDKRRRVKLLWDFIARFQLAMRPPDKIVDAVMEYCDFANLRGESSSYGALHPKQSPQFKCSAAIQPSSERLATRCTDFLSSGLQEGCHVLCLWCALQVPPAEDGPFSAGVLNTHCRPSAVAMVLTGDVIDPPPPASSLSTYHLLLLAPQ